MLGADYKYSDLHRDIVSVATFWWKSVSRLSLDPEAWMVQNLRGQRLSWLKLGETFTRHDSFFIQSSTPDGKHIANSIPGLWYHTVHCARLQYRQQPVPGTYYRRTWRSPRDVGYKRTACECWRHRPSAGYQRTQPACMDHNTASISTDIFKTPTILWCHSPPIWLVALTTVCTVKYRNYSS